MFILASESVATAGPNLFIQIGPKMILNHFLQEVDAFPPLFSVHSLSYAHLSITNGFYLVLASAAIVTLLLLVLAGGGIAAGGQNHAC